MRVHQLCSTSNRGECALLTSGNEPSSTLGLSTSFKMLMGSKHGSTPWILGGDGATAHWVGSIPPHLDLSNGSVAETD